jgi:hypothetical protein
VTTLLLAHYVYEVDVIGMEKRGRYVKWSKEQLSMTAFEEVTIREAATNGIRRVLLLPRYFLLRSAANFPSATLHMHVMLRQSLKIRGRCRLLFHACRLMVSTCVDR